MNVLIPMKLLHVVTIVGFAWFAGAAETTDEEQIALRSAQTGSIVHPDKFLASRQELPSVPVQIQSEAGPQFLFSDKPEYLMSGDGVTLREKVKPGKVRLYLYHVPTPGEASKTISAIIENLGTKPLALRFLHRAVPAPGKDYHLIGKTGLLEYFKSSPERQSLTLAPGAKAVLDPKLDAAVATRDQLVHAFYEFEISQPAQVTVFQRGTTDQSLAMVDTLPLLPQSLPEKASGNGAGRGLFPICNFKVTNARHSVCDTSDGAQQLVVANGKSEGWIEGWDSIDGKVSRNVGNYGVLYRIRLKRMSSDGRSLALLMCKIGSASRWCGAQAGAVTIRSGNQAPQVVAIPEGQTVYTQPGEAVLIQKFPPLRKGKSETIEIVYSPPGASCIPTPMILVPYRE